MLGLVHGATEFLPVSSSGHLVLMRDLLQLGIKNTVALDALFHFATAAAVILYFWRDLLTLAQALFRKLGRLPVNEKDMVLLKALALGTIPAVIVGVVLQSYVDSYVQSNVPVAVGLFIGALFFMFAEWKHFTQPNYGSVNVRTGLLIGVFQLLALMPGLSRFGSTLAGGMWLGLSRLEAARFSFLLAIPITLGVGTTKTLELIVTEGEVAWFFLGIGALTAFFTALIVIHYFLLFVRRYSVWPFIWYSLVIAALIVYSELLV